MSCCLELTSCEGGSALISFKGHLFISLIKVELMYTAWDKNDALHILHTVSEECHLLCVCVSVCVCVR